MKKILSILMVAVLSLNLLYQPCAAAGTEKEAVSAVTQESQKVGDETSKKSSDEKAKTKGPQSWMWRRFKNIAMCCLYAMATVYTLVMGCELVYDAGYNEASDRWARKLSEARRDAYTNGYSDASYECGERVRNARAEAYSNGYGAARDYTNSQCDEKLRKAKDESFSAGYKAAKGKCDEMVREARDKAYDEGYKRATRGRERQCKGMVDFRLEDMSAKCLKRLLVCSHPDVFECYPLVKDFRVAVQEEYDKKTMDAK